VRLLVTGGCGFIGSNFVRLVLAERPGWTVVNLDLLTYAGNPENLADVAGDPRYAFVRGDIADPAAVGDAVARGIDAIVNFAAESHVDRSIEGAAPFIRTNVVGTLTLLEAARRIDGCRFVQISTDEVYGALELDEPRQFLETDPLAPNSPYAASKAGADLLVRSFVRTYGLAAVVTRCSNNYGPYQFPEKFIPLMILRAIAGEALPIYGDGLYVRDWIHVEDHCRAVLAALERGAPGEIYNIGGGAERANIDVARRILVETGQSAGRLEHVADRRGHDRRYAVGEGKLRAELGWAPVHDFEQGLSGTIAWYRAHESWWRRITSGDYLVDRRSAVPLK
jgi:dTDP-glucose 4,6-dehydratase